MDHETHGKMPGERESKDAIINMAITRDDVQQMQLQSMNVKSTAAGTWITWIRRVDPQPPLEKRVICYSKVAHC
jgi:hypothetical protein